MNAANQKKKFEEHITDIVTAFANECQSNKRIALKLKISSVLLSAIVTVCLGLKSTDNTTWGTVLSDVALVLSALISVVSAYEAFFDPRSLWIRETIVFTKLRNLKREFEFWDSGCEESLTPEQVEKLESFQQKLDQILVDSLKNWMRIRGVSEPDAKGARKPPEEV